MGSNYTSYTTDPIHSSLSSLVSDVNSKHPKSKFILEASNTFVEDDVTETNDLNEDNNLYVPEMNNRNYVSPMKAQNYDFYGGKLSRNVGYHFDKIVLLIYIHFRTLHSKSFRCQLSTKAAKLSMQQYKSE